jgi:hypothetical protein
MQDSKFFNKHQDSMNPKDDSYLKPLENSRVFVLSRLARNYPINYVLRVLNFYKLAYWFLKTNQIARTDCQIRIV